MTFKVKMQIQDEDNNPIFSHSHIQASDIFEACQKIKKPDPMILGPNRTCIGILIAEKEEV